MTEIEQLSDVQCPTKPVYKKAAASPARRNVPKAIVVLGLTIIPALFFVMSPAVWPAEVDGRIASCWKAAKLLGPDSTALMEKTIPDWQWLT